MMEENNPIQKAIQETNILFSAIRTVANRAFETVGYNKPFTFAPGLTVTYELYDKGPEHIYYSQYAHLNEKELGEKVGLSNAISEENFLQREKLYKRIVIREGEEPVCIMQGRGGLQMALHEDGPWEDELKRWADGEVL